MSEASTKAQPKVIGNITPEELTQMTQMRQASDGLVMQLGRLRLQEQQVLQQIQQVQGEAQQVLSVVGKRLGIPDGVPWQVDPKGQAILVPMPELASEKMPKVPPVEPESAQEASKAS